MGMKNIAGTLMSTVEMSRKKTIYLSNKLIPNVNVNEWKLRVREKKKKLLYISQSRSMRYK